MISTDPKLPQETDLQTWVARFISRFYSLWRELVREITAVRSIATTQSWASYYPGTFNVPTNTGRLFISNLILVGSETASVTGTGTIRIV